MALRIRQPSGEILCAAKCDPLPDDDYISDGLHYRLSVEYGVLIPEPDEDTTGRWRWAEGAERPCLRDPAKRSMCCAERS